MAISFDPTVNAGHLLTFFGFVVGGIAFAWATRSDIRVVSVRQEAHGKALEKLDSHMSKMTEVLVKSGRIEERQVALTERMQEQDKKIERNTDDIADLRRGKVKSGS